MAFRLAEETEQEQAEVAGSGTLATSAPRTAENGTHTVTGGQHPCLGKEARASAHHTLGPTSVHSWPPPLWRPNQDEPLPHSSSKQTPSPVPNHLWGMTAGQATRDMNPSSVLTSLHLALEPRISSTLS